MLAQAVIDPLKTQYVDFEGRTSRGSFWLFIAVYFLFALTVSAVEMFLGTIFMTTMSSFALMLPSLAITTRRLHDIGMSGWWQLIGFIPMIGLFILAALLARQGVNDSNHYGDPDWVEKPKEPVVPAGFDPSTYDPSKEEVEGEVNFYDKN